MLAAGCPLRWRSCPQPEPLPRPHPSPRTLPLDTPIAHAAATEQGPLRDVSRFSLVRDVVLYLLVVLATLGCCYDGVITLWEALTFLGTYCVYISIIVAHHRRSGRSGLGVGRIGLRVRVRVRVGGERHAGPSCVVSP